LFFFVELVDALDRLQHRLPVLDHAERIAVFLRIAVFHDPRARLKPTLQRLDLTKIRDFCERVSRTKS